MHGPVLTMPSGIDTESVLLRPLSTSNIPDLSLDYKVSTALPRHELPRSASFTSEPTPDIPPYEANKQLYLGISTDVSPKHAEDRDATDGTAGGENVSATEEEPKLERLGRTRSLVARPKSWIQRVKGSPERAGGLDSDGSTSSGAPARRTLSKPPRDKSRTASGSFVTFARKSWISSSRSPSPNLRTDIETVKGGQDGDALRVAPDRSPSAPRLSSTHPQQLERPTLPRSSTSPPKALSRSESTFQKIKRRPQSVLMNFTTFNSSNSSASSLPRSSLDNRSTPRTSIDKIPPVPSLNTLPKITSDAPLRRDELWSSFRSLDNDFSKFQSKSWSLKTNVVRAALLPFLSNHISHPSNRNLRPEDLDRRVMILNKWWAGILEVLDGRQNQTVSGVDRPVLLEAVTAIMMRPEWRMPPSAFALVSERSPDQSPERGPLRKQKSTESLGSSNSQFLTESVYHNIRNIFTQNLLSQMKFVVDKMSLRNAPASLVSFCGKTAAYAFFFVPGVAEILVRLWKLPAETLRRAADELGLPKRINQIDVDDVVAAFPPHMQLLCWTSPKLMVSQLQKKPLIPLLAGNVLWYGPWITRWRGRDSDLFFVFTKYYHILAEEFLPSTLALPLKARAPGFVLVQAQLLTALDATFHRQPPAEPLPITFDDVLAGAGASAAVLPLPSSNSARLMAENRLIVLLRDFISEKPSDYETAQMTFAESFEKMMRAATRRISLFDHNACFILCDFVDEALVIFVRFHLSRSLDSDLIDWYFWLDVCKKMLDSQNTMSQIRLFSLVYTTWSVITNDERRKEVLCLDWLLTEETFGSFFNHWCPMVRAYYMRLLCWRICRECGESTDLDTKIFSTAYTRLKSNWAQYLFLRQAAETGHTFPPSTAPCHPAPGRRLLIIRNDEHSPASNLFFGFEGIMPSQSGTVQLFANKRHSLATVSNISTTENSIPKLTIDASASAQKRRWSFMGKMLPSALSIPDNLSFPAKGSSPTKTLEEARRETALARRKQGHGKSASTDSETPPSTSTHRAYTFKFSLEWTQHFDRPQNASTGDPNLANSERRLFLPRLPLAAHVWLGSKVSDIGHEVLPKNPAEWGPGSDQVARSKYVGRALAEWALIVGECNNFAERRQAEGVPGLKWVEIPTLGVEGFRR